ncbi:MAG: hypothetical protein PHE73_04630 [Sulfurovaceae bacterium]|nr:hypothetical protein [Sulfurovaceae bacterium]
MKQIVLTILSGTAILCATSLSVKDIDTMVAKIQTTRSGMNAAQFESVSDPFIYFEVNSTTGAFMAPKEQNDDTIIIGGIMNNKVYIDGSWKRIGEKVGNYTIRSIGVNTVVLYNGRKIKKLFISNKKDNNLIKIQGR